ncbi:MAG: hypothetical protein PHS83_05755 [Clostridia bacterium]|jgi:hypothetical protein|nr:hypothetical protein [Desulfitobacteriaceae bacterium]MDD4146579.1 hypothetical protein [Clostridia bacterium]MDD4665367.1 hypothetical protein [Clostridia bacterium]
MKKKSLILVLVLLGLSSLMVAMAYTSAEVQAGYTVKVADADKALLALAPHDNSGKIAYIDDRGNLMLDFGKVGDKDYGLQPGSTYKWSNLVDVINNSTDTVTVNLEVTGGLTDNLIITDKPGNNGRKIKNTELAPGRNNRLMLTFTVSVPENAGIGTDLTGSIVVTAEAGN